MPDAQATIRRLLDQQAAIARFGSFALREPDVWAVVNEAARVCADGLAVRFCKICRYRAASNDLLVEAGIGWQPGIVGHVVSRADASSPQGRAFVTGEAVISRDLRADATYDLPSFYAAHGIVSTVDVVIAGPDQPYGVLEIAHDQERDYGQHEVDFLTGFANVLAEALATSARVAELQTAVERMRVLVEDKDRLLDQKKVLAQELQHRVRNNLQLVQGMLNRQSDETADPVGQRGVRAIARRVSTLAQVYDHLLGNEMTRTTDLGGYVRSLCLDLAAVQATADGRVTLTCSAGPLVLDLDVVTALGIIVTELVTNSYDHAFPGTRGSIAVTVHRPEPEHSTATLTVRDDGPGFAVSAADKRHGVGLVRRLVEQVGGTATLESQGGTVWTIRFPVH